MGIEKIWSTAIKVTGPVGVVGLLFWTLMNFVFREDVIVLFGSEKIFVYAMILASCFFIALITAILVYRNTKPVAANMTDSKPEGNKAIVKRSKISGDFVMGNKTVNSRDKNE